MGWMPPRVLWRVTVAVGAVGPFPAGFGGAWAGVGTAGRKLGA
ncbi:hypothetical protein [Streptomyces lydicus]